MSNFRNVIRARFFIVFPIITRLNLSTLHFFKQKSSFLKNVNYIKSYSFDFDFKKNCLKKIAKVERCLDIRRQGFVVNVDTMGFVCYESGLLFYFSLSTFVRIYPLYIISRCLVSEVSRTKQSLRSNLKETSQTRHPKEALQRSAHFFGRFKVNFCVLR